MEKKNRSLTLILFLEGKERKFVTPKHIKGTLYDHAVMIERELVPKETGEFNELGEPIYTEIDILQNLDDYKQFVCEVFGNQFTISEFEEGVDARDLTNVIYSMTYFVIGQVGLAAKMLAQTVDIMPEEVKKNKIV